MAPTQPIATPADVGWSDDRRADHAHFPLFDSLRAVAALTVLVFHAAQQADGATAAVPDRPWEAIAARLPVGVTIFFLISGFLLYRPFVAARLGDGRAPRLGDFARRRILRIVPAYWVALVLLYALGMAWFPGGVLPDGLLLFAFGQIYSEATFTAAIGVSWSLCVEMTFYLVLPFYAAVAARALRDRDRDRAARLELAALAVLAVASLAFTTVVYGAGAEALAQTLPGYFGWFALGMALAVVSATGYEPRWRVSRVLMERAGLAWSVSLGLLLVTAAAAGLPSMAETFPSPHSTGQWALERVLYGAIAFFLLLPAVFAAGRRGIPQRILAMPALVWIGLISYGVYLWHAGLIGWYRSHAGSLLQGGPELVFLQLLVVGLVGSVIAGAASYYLVERPALRLRRPVRGAAGARLPARRERDSTRRTRQPA